MNFFALGFLLKSVNLRFRVLSCGQGYLEMLGGEGGMFREQGGRLGNITT